MKFRFPLLAAVLTAGITVFARIDGEALVEVVSALETQISALEEKIDAATVVPAQVSATIGDAAVASDVDADDSDDSNDDGNASMSISIPAVASNDTSPNNTDTASDDANATNTETSSDDTGPINTDSASNDTSATNTDTPTDDSDGSDDNTADDPTPPGSLSKRWTADDRTAQLRCLNSNGGAYGLTPDNVLRQCNDKPLTPSVCQAQCSCWNGGVRCQAWSGCASNTMTQVCTCRTRNDEDGRCDEPGAPCVCRRKGSQVETLGKGS
jgi:hypothetical protein